MNTQVRSQFSRQDWLKCMDKFADFVEEARPPTEPVKNHQHQEQAAEGLNGERIANLKPKYPQVKVAIIDDGVKSSVGRLNDLIECGESWVEQANPRQRYSPYNTSSRGHGTVMAYYIGRVCPNVRLCVAKLNPLIVQGQVTFSIESATAVSAAVLLHGLRHDIESDIHIGN